MKRIFEKLAFANVFAPQSVEASTEKTTGYVDASGTEEVAFLISAAALGKGKSLTVTLMAADDASGSGAKAVGEAAVFTDPVGTEPQVVAVSYQVSPRPVCGGQAPARRRGGGGVRGAGRSGWDVSAPGQWHDPGGMRWPSRRS